MNRVFGEWNNSVSDDYSMTRHCSALAFNCFVRSADPAYVDVDFHGSWNSRTGNLDHQGLLEKELGDGCGDAFLYCLTLPLVGCHVTNFSRASAFIWPYDILLCCWPPFVEDFGVGSH